MQNQVEQNLESLLHSGLFIVQYYYIAQLQGFILTTKNQSGLNTRSIQMTLIFASC